MPHGEVKFEAGDMLLGEPKVFLDGRCASSDCRRRLLLREPAAKVGDAVQDDYPRLLGPLQDRQALPRLGRLSEGRRTASCSSSATARTANGPKPIEVAGAGDHFRVALASTHNDTLWIVWASQRDNSWNLFGRPYKDGKLGDESPL